jgi:prepilin-type N-terminal cleavage/methylation domain-containing protein
MMKRHSPLRADRRGFTLVEMLVVMGIFLLLAALTVAFLANFRGSSSSQATSQIYGWLSQARQRALRDGNPYGVRLLLNPNDPTQVVQLQYIEQPEDFYIPGTIYSDLCPTGNPAHDNPIYASGKCPAAGLGYYYVEFSPAQVNPGTVDFTGGFQQDSTLWPVQPGDYLEVNGSGKVHRIASTGLGDPVNGVNYNGVNPTAGNLLGLVLASQPDYPAGTGWQYRVIRRSRVVGEDALRLPQNIVIDLNQTGKDGYSPPSISPLGYDIMFGPKGQVIGQAASLDKLVLWVRDTTGAKTDATFDPNLIVINTRSGAISWYRVDTSVDSSGNFVDPYSETRTGQTSPQ